MGGKNVHEREEEKYVREYARGETNNQSRIFAPVSLLRETTHNIAISHDVGMVVRLRKQSLLHQHDIRSVRPYSVVLNRSFFGEQILDKHINRPQSIIIY